MKHWLMGLFVLVTAVAFAQREDFANISFLKSDSVATAYRGASLQNLPLLAFNLTNALSSDVEKFRSIFKWVAENITNDYELYSRNQSKRAKLTDVAELKAWNEKAKTQMFEHLIHRKSTVCTGYAYLVKELSALAGIKAEIVDGYGRTIRSNVGGDGVVNHSWNAVRLNDRWYLCDATWASGVIDITHHQFIPKYEDVYFLSSPDYFIRNHYPIEPQWMLTTDALALKTFLNQPIVYAAAYKHRILPLQPDVFGVSIENKTLRLTINSDLPGTIEKLQLKTNNRLLKPIALTHSPNGIVTLEYDIKKSGSFIVHGFVGGDAVFSYRVKVE